MAGHYPQDPEVDRFILEEIDSVPHMEALLLLWNSRPRAWTASEMASALYISEASARTVLQSLVRSRLCSPERGPLEAGAPRDSAEELEGWRYDGVSRTCDELVRRVEEAYRRELVRIARMIHAKGTPGMRGFAEAFRFKKDRE